MFLSLKRLYPPTNNDDDADARTVASSRSTRTGRRFRLNHLHFGGGNDDDKSVRSTHTTGRFFTRSKADVPPEVTHSPISIKKEEAGEKKDDAGEKKPKKKRSTTTNDSPIVSPRRVKGEADSAPSSPKKPTGVKKKTKSSSDLRRHTRKKELPPVRSGGAAHSDWKMIVPDTLNPNHTDNYKKRRKKKRLPKDPNLPQSSNNSDEEAFNDSLMNLSQWTQSSTKSLRDESDSKPPSEYTFGGSNRSLMYDDDEEEDQNKPSSENTIPSPKEGADDDDDGGARPTKPVKDKKSRAFLKSLGFGGKISSSKRKKKSSSHRRRLDARPITPTPDVEPQSAPSSPVTQAAVKNAGVDNNKRNRLLIDAANHISTPSIYLDDPSKLLLNDIKKQYRSIDDDDCRNDNSDSYDNNDEDEITKLKNEAIKSRIESVKLRDKLDWAMAEVEKLTKERKAEKKQLKKVSNQLDQVRTNYTKAMREVAQQEEIIIERDMRILALEETRQNEGDNKEGVVKGSQSQTKPPKDDDDDEDSEDLRPAGTAGGGVEQRQRERMFSPMQKIRSMEQAMQKQVEEKDKKIEKLELELEVLKRTKERAEPSMKPVEDLVEENKILRQELVTLLDMQREYLALKAATKGQATGKVDDDSINGKDEADANNIVSDADQNRLPVNVFKDGDDDLDIAQVEELHRRLSDEGISPTFDVPADWNNDSLSVLSMGDDSYLEDLENQVANKLDEQEEALMEEAREMYKIALEEKGIKESREILLYIYNELREETKEERQKEYLQLAAKLHEARKQVAEDKRKMLAGEDEEDKGETGSGGVLREVKRDFQRRKSINYNEMVKEIRKANATRGDNEIKKDLLETKELLLAREKEIVDLKRRLHQEAAATPKMKEEIRKLEVKKTTITQKLKDELKEANDRLDRKDETIAFMQKQFEESNQNTESIVRIVELEREVEKYKKLASERKNDVAAAKVEIEELREELESRPGAEKSYFKRKKDTAGSDDERTLGSALSDMLKWGGEKVKEPPPLGSSLTSFSWTPDKAIELPKPLASKARNGDDDVPSNIMGNFVKGYFRSGGVPSSSSEPPQEVVMDSCLKLTGDASFSSLDISDHDLVAKAQNPEGCIARPKKSGNFVKNYLRGSGGGDTGVATKEDPALAEKQLGVPSDTGPLSPNTHPDTDIEKARPEASSPRNLEKNVSMRQLANDPCPS